MTVLWFASATGLNVPVEVYDDELRLVDRTLSSRGVTVGAGTYFVLARLPDGSQVRESVIVDDETTVEVQLRAPGVALPSGRTRMFVRDVADFDASTERRTAALIGYAREDDGTWAVAHNAIDVADHAEGSLPADLDAVAVDRSDGNLSIIRIPGRRVEYFRFAVAPTGVGDGVSLVARLANPTGDALLNYLNQDMVYQARTILDAPELTAEELLYGKRKDPVAAAAGAYALLRLEAIDRLHDWTRNLANWFEWLPDGLVAWAEHLARLGQHEQAAGMLSRLPERGLPALSLGLTYACDRLRTYARRWPDNVRLGETLEELMRYTMAADLAAPVTTYIGQRPDVPTPLAPAAPPRASAG